MHCTMQSNNPRSRLRLASHAPYQPRKSWGFRGAQSLRFENLTTSNFQGSVSGANEQSGTINIHPPLRNHHPPTVHKRNAGKQTKVIVITTAMLVFISFWRAAAIVLCDLASTAYYIGGIVEQAVGNAAPWFILAVMLFSYAVRASTSSRAPCSCAAASTGWSRKRWAARWPSCRCRR